MVDKISGLISLINSRLKVLFLIRINKQLETKKAGDTIVYRKDNMSVKKIKL
tara:strand:+ start:89 stop:244 length:156 start_codon:yes stop_codon:yes gene_type:complete